MNLSQRIGLSTLSVRDSQRLNEEHASRVREAQEAAQIAAFSCEITLDAVRNGVKNTIINMRAPPKTKYQYNQERKRDFRQAKANNKPKSKYSIMYEAVEDPSGPAYKNLEVDDSLFTRNYTHPMFQDALRVVHKSFATFKTLERIDVAHQLIGDAGLADLCSHLRTAPVTYLNLSGNRITDIGVRHLAGILRSLHHLKFLNMSWNQITDTGIRTLCDRTHYHSGTVCQYDFTYNILTPVSGHYLGSLFIGDNSDQHACPVSELRLGGQASRISSSWGDSFFQQFCSPLMTSPNLSRLNVLHLVDFQLSDVGVQCLCGLLLCDRCGLTEINISRNFLSPKSRRLLFRTFVLTTHRFTLFAYDCGLSIEEVRDWQEHIINAPPEKKVLLRRMLLRTSDCSHTARVSQRALLQCHVAQYYLRQQQLNSWGGLKLPVRWQRVPLRYLTTRRQDRVALQQGSPPSSPSLAHSSSSKHRPTSPSATTTSGAALPAIAGTSTVAKAGGMESAPKPVDGDNNGNKLIDDQDNNSNYDNRDDGDDEETALGGDAEEADEELAQYLNTLRDVGARQLALSLHYLARQAQPIHALQDVLSFLSVTHQSQLPTEIPPESQYPPLAWPARHDLLLQFIALQRTESLHNLRFVPWTRRVEQALWEGKRFLQDMVQKEATFLAQQPMRFRRSMNSSTISAKQEANNLQSNNSSSKIMVNSDKSKDADRGNPVQATSPLGPGDLGSKTSKRQALFSGDAITTSAAVTHAAKVATSSLPVIQLTNTSVPVAQAPSTRNRAALLVPPRVDTLTPAYEMLLMSSEDALSSTLEQDAIDTSYVGLHYWTRLLHVACAQVTLANRMLLSSAAPASGPKTPQSHRFGSGAVGNLSQRSNVSASTLTTTNTTVTQGNTGGGVTLPNAAMAIMLSHSGNNASASPKHAHSNHLHSPHHSTVVTSATIPGPTSGITAAVGSNPLNTTSSSGGVNSVSVGTSNTITAPTTASYHSMHSHMNINSSSNHSIKASLLHETIAEESAEDLFRANFSPPQSANTPRRKHYQSHTGAPTASSVSSASLPASISASASASAASFALYRHQSHSPTSHTSASPHNSQYDQSFKETDNSQHSGDRSHLPLTSGAIGGEEGAALTYSSASVSGPSSVSSSEHRSMSNVPNNLPNLRIITDNNGVDHSKGVSSSSHPDPSVNTFNNEEEDNDSHSNSSSYLLSTGHQKHHHHNSDRNNQQRQQPLENAESNDDDGGDLKPAVKSEHKQKVPSQIPPPVKVPRARLEHRMNAHPNRSRYDYSAAPPLPRVVEEDQQQHPPEDQQMIGHGNDFASGLVSMQSSDLLGQTKAHPTATTGGANGMGLTMNNLLSLSLHQPITTGVLMDLDAISVSSRSTTTSKTTSTSFRHTAGGGSKKEHRQRQQLMQAEEARCHAIVRQGASFHTSMISSLVPCAQSLGALGFYVHYLHAVYAKEKDDVAEAAKAERIGLRRSHSNMEGL